MTFEHVPFHFDMGTTFAFADASIMCTASLQTSGEQPQLPARRIWISLPDDSSISLRNMVFCCVLFLHPNLSLEGFSSQG